MGQYIHSRSGMRHFLLLTALSLLAAALQAQDAALAVDNKPHKVVIQLTSNDSLVHKAVIRQIANILEAAPRSKIEVVCHSNGITFLQAAQFGQAARIAELHAKGVAFMACENTMRERKITRGELLPQSGTVPSGVMEVIKKQEKNWAYLRAGL